MKKLSGDKALAEHLATGKGLFYGLFAEQILQLDEARDQIRKACAADERSVYLLDVAGDFAELADEVNSASLFGTSRLLEFVGSNQLSATQAASVMAIAEAADSSINIIVATPPPRKAKWLTEFEKLFIRVDLPAVPRQRHLGWVTARALKADLQLDEDVLELIARLTEGNLAAAAQQLQQLRMVADSAGKVDYSYAYKVIFDNSKDDVFSLREALTSGDFAGSQRALTNLQATGIALPLVVWAIVAEIRTLLTLIDSGRAWVPSRKHLIDLQSAAKRVPRPAVVRMLFAAAKLDWQSKGIGGKVDAWVTIERLICAYSQLVRTNRLSTSLLR